MFCDGGMVRYLSGQGVEAQGRASVHAALQHLLRRHRLRLRVVRRRRGPVPVPVRGGALHAPDDVVQQKQGSGDGRVVAALVRRLHRLVHGRHRELVVAVEHPHGGQMQERLLVPCPAEMGLAGSQGGVGGGRGGNGWCRVV